METMTYRKYCSLVPKDTVKFLDRFLEYLSVPDDIEVDDVTIIQIYDKYFFKSLLALAESSRAYQDKLHTIGFDIPNEKVSRATFYYDEEKEKVFSKYIELFDFYDNDDDYLDIYPENIVTNIYEQLSGVSVIKTSAFIKNDIDDFIKELEKMGKAYCDEKFNEIISKVYENIDVDKINYFDIVGQLFDYMFTNKDNLDDSYPKDRKSIIHLSLFVALYFYNMEYKDDNVVNMIVDYLNSKGLTLDKIKKVLGFDFDVTEESVDRSSLYIYRNFINIVKDYAKNSTEDMFYNIFSKDLNKSIILKFLFSSSESNIKSFDDLIALIKEFDLSHNAMSADQILNGLKPAVYQYMETVATYHKYLSDKYKGGTINTSIVDTPDDIEALSVILASYTCENDLSRYLSSIGLTIEKIESLLNVPISNAKLETYTNSDMNIVKKYISNNVFPNIPKDKITINYINTLIYDKKFEKSDILSRLLSAINCNVILENLVIKDELDKLDKKEKEKNRNELELSLLQGLPKDTYNYIQSICSYYLLLTQYKTPVSNDVLASMSIILAAHQCNSGLSAYLDSIGLSEKDILKGLNLGSIVYREKDIDIFTVEEVFKKYIFDRDKKDITLYTILDNAIKLNTNFALDKFLYSLDITRDVYKDTKKETEAYKEVSKQKKIKENVDNLFIQCACVSNIFDDILRFHTYFSNKVEANTFKGIIETENDIEEASIIIAILLNGNNSYLQYLSNNGITLDEVLKQLGISKEELIQIRTKEYDRNLILNYKKYIKDNVIDDNTLVRRVFDDSINDSKVLEVLTALTGNRYDYLKEETTNKKFRPLTPEDGIKLLSKEIIPLLRADSISDVSLYGNELSKHSIVISDALQQLAFSDSLEHSVEDINKLCNDVIVLPEEEPKGIFALFNRKRKTEYNYSEKAGVISNIKTAISENVQTLNDELKGYEIIKRYIEEYLYKTDEYLTRLQEFKVLVDARVEELSNAESSGNMKSFTELLDYKDLQDILDKKINSFNTNIVVMKQELVKVHRAIISHFVTIDALNTSNSAILPMIATEFALNAGSKTDAIGLDISRNLVNLLQSVVNQNVEETLDTLDKLQSVTGFDPIALDNMTRSVNQYIDVVNDSKKLLTGEQEDVKKMTLE